MNKNNCPNLLWIMADEFRPDFLGISGNPDIQTPNLDALAKEGVLMENTFCQASPCAPSRMSIHTGRYMCSTGVVDNMTPLAEADDNIAAHLRNHGFSPAIFRSGTWKAMRSMWMMMLQTRMCQIRRPLTSARTPVQVLHQPSSICP